MNPECFIEACKKRDTKAVIKFLRNSSNKHLLIDDIMTYFDNEDILKILSRIKYISKFIAEFIRRDKFNVLTKLPWKDYLRENLWNCVASHGSKRILELILTETNRKNFLKNYSSGMFIFRNDECIRYILSLDLEKIEIRYLLREAISSRHEIFYELYKDSGNRSYIIHESDI